MDAKLLEFAHLLRENGVRVSPAEDLDTFAAIRVVGLGDRQLTKDVLRATMIKRAVDVAVFDELFDLYFSGLAEALKAATQRAQEAVGNDPARFEELLQRLEKLLAEHGQDLSELARDWLRDDEARVEQRVRQAIQEGEKGQGTNPTSAEGQMSHALAQTLGLAGLLQEIEAFRDRLGAMGLDPQELEQMQKYLEQRLRDLAALVKQAARQEVEKRDVQRRESQRLQALGEKNFYYLTEDDMRRMRDAVTRLARRLKNVIAIRRKRSRRGRFDLKRTLRRNLQYGGIPFDVHFAERRKEKPQVVVLCDVSDSVRNASRFMLQFVYGLQDLYSKVRSFIFVAEPGEITRLFEENDVQDAIEQSLSGDIINVFAHSDFGRAFKMFHRDFLTAVNKRTTVIVLGDARNNYNLPHEWALRDIRNRAKQLIWLNPESRMTWGFGDSEMDRYRPHCDIVEECRNLNQLYRVIDRIVAP
ncbi:MAG: VWA domain-containing protein [Candidatus Binatia bacterium]